MKKLLVVTGLVLSSMMSYGQFTKSYLGEKYKSYENRLVKINVDDFYHSDVFPKFWSKVPESKISSENKISKIDILNLKDEVFKIDSIFNFNSYSGRVYKLFRLTNVKTKNSIYYFYTVYTQSDNCLLMERTENDYISDIEKEVDDFTGEIRFTTPRPNQVGISHNPLGTIVKHIDKKGVSYFLSLDISSPGIFKGNGVYILFTDGTKWSRPNEKIDVNYDKGYVNSAFIKITESDLQIFKTKTIKKCRLYIVDKEVDLVDANEFKVYSSLIVKSKK
jgi:hypothetical protein